MSEIGFILDFVELSQVRVFSLQFSPTGQAWAAATTEGLLVYSQYAGLIFDPWDLQMGVTPAAVRTALSEENYTDGKYIFF